MEMKKAFGRLLALMCTLTLLLCGTAPAEGAAAPSPASAAETTPSPEELGGLVFRIDGPGEGQSVTVKYSDFRDGEYLLENLAPGTYTVTEINPDRLVDGYTLNRGESVRKATVEVKADGKAVVTLKNIYEKSPEGGDERISIRVSKVWEDAGNRDGNRPQRVTVNLLADGKRAAGAVLNEAGGWAWEFTDLPRFAGGREIHYTVTEDPVPLYTARVDGFVITNAYTPGTTSASVAKVWLDNENEKGLRPAAVRCTLSSGDSVLLNEANGWQATVEGLPAVVNGKPAEYTWTEQEVIGYENTAVDRSGNLTVFTNALTERGELLPEGKRVPVERRGDAFLVIREYGTPLGVETEINHVGDCFD